MRRMAKLDMANRTLKSASGHRRDEEVSAYTGAAKQDRLADEAIVLAARWEFNRHVVRTAINMMLRGGPSRNRTGVQGFAVLCVTTPPSGLGASGGNAQVLRPLSTLQCKNSCAHCLAKGCEGDTSRPT